MAINKAEKQELISCLIGKLVIGTITDEEREVIDAWCKESPKNEAVLARLHDTERLATEYRRRKLADYRRPLSDMKRRLGLTETAPAKTRTFRLYQWAAAVAAVVIIVAGGYLTRDRWTGNDSVSQQQVVAKAEIRPGTTQAVLTLDDGRQVELGADEKANKSAIEEATDGKTVAFQDISTPRGGEFKVTLEDGTEVWLNAASRLRYPETFDGDERRVELEGEAYFKVAKDAAKPFYVVSGGQEVRVYGTEFNIHAYGDEPMVYTTLISGSISLRPTTVQKSELMLTPGHQAVFDKATAAATVHREDVEMVVGWRNGVFVFENQDMSQIMRTLSRWYNFDYEFADKRVASVEFMGSVPRYSSFQEVVSIFDKVGGIRITEQGGKVIVSAK